MSWAAPYQLAWHRQCPVASACSVYTIGGLLAGGSAYLVVEKCRSAGCLATLAVEIVQSQARLSIKRPLEFLGTHELIASFYPGDGETDSPGPRALECHPVRWAGIGICFVNGGAAS
eukprot:9849488-Alexandrium_andersonii.AAC.1